MSDGQVRWWFQRILGVVFAREQDYDAVHALTNGIPLLVGDFQMILLPNGSPPGGVTPSTESFTAACQAFSRRLDDLTSAKKLSDQLTDREKDFLRMAQTVAEVLGARALGSRALLQLDPARNYADFLRGSMLCLPISQELITACFLIETHIRGRIRLPSEPPQGAGCQDLWLRFTSGGSFASTIYPPGYPGYPHGPWAFAILGEILAHEIGSPSGFDWRHQVRELRNHLVHGHHASWHAIRLARQLARRFTL